MVNTGVKLLNIAAQDITITSAEFSESTDCLVLPLLLPAGVGIINKHSFKYRFQHIDDSVMDHSVSERGGGYKALLMLKNIKIRISAWAVGPVFQLRFQLADKFLKMVLKIRDCFPVSFSAPCFVKSIDQIFKRANFKI